MPFKINIGCKGKSWRFDLEDESLVGKSVGETLKGEEIKPELSGYELKITGGSDNAGFPMFEEVEGLGLSKKLLTKGKGMRDNRPGVRIRKTVRGKTISLVVTQVNMVVLKEGNTPIEQVFPDQNKVAEPVKEEKAEEAPVAEAPAAA